MRKTLVGIAALVMGLLAPATAAAAPGDLDTTFGSPNGFITYETFLPDDAAIQDALVEPGTGKIVAAVLFSPSPHWGIVRFLPSGALDPSFNPGGAMPGVQRIDPTSQINDTPHAITRTPDGKYVVAGTAPPTFLVVSRFEADGDPDTSFNDGVAPGSVPGVEQTDISDANSVDKAVGVSVGSNGAITVGADTTFPSPGTPSGSTILAARFEEDGDIDDAFDESPTVAPTGVVYVEGGGDPGDEETGAGMLVDPTGRTVLIGTALDDDEPSQIFVGRLTGTGTRDMAFSGDGIQQFNLGSALASDSATDVLRQPDGRLVLAASKDGLLTPASFTVAALTDAGELDTGFGTGGSTTATVGEVAELGIPTRIARQPDGKLVLAGNRLMPPFPTGPSFVRLVRFRADGQIDTAYGSQGVAQPATFASPNPFVSALDINAAGQAVVGGLLPTTPLKPFLARFQGDPPPVAGPPAVPAPATPSAATGQRAAALKKCKKKKSKKARKKCKKRALRLPV